jgi:hypothetical protein
MDAESECRDVFVKEVAHMQDDLRGICYRGYIFVTDLNVK